MFDLLMELPTRFTLAMFPVLGTMYTVLARLEQAESKAGLATSGVPTHRAPRFLPRLTRMLPVHRETISC